jgi:HK97 family phage major capsid protein
MEDIKKELENLKTTVKADFIKEVEAKLEARDKALEEGSTQKANDLKNELEKMGDKFQTLYNESITEIKNAQSEMAKIKDFKNNNKSETLNSLAKKMAEEVKTSIVAKGGDVPFGKNFKLYDAEKSANLYRTKAAGDMTLGNYSGNPSVSFASDGINILPSLLHIRQLLSVGVMSSEVFQYEVEAARDGAAGLAAEGVTVGQLDNDFTTTTATAYKVGGFYRTSEESLKDVAWLSRFLQVQGIERVMDAEDAELLTGTTEIVGIGVNATTDLVAAAYVTPSGITPNKFDALMFAISKLLALRVRANGIVISPVDMAMLYQSRASDGQYLAPGTLIWNGAQPYVHGVPVFVSNAVADDAFYVGDWSTNSAEILQRDGLSVNFYEQDGNNAVQGKVTIRIQERIAFPIYRPTSFLAGDFSNILTSLTTA